MKKITLLISISLFVRVAFSQITFQKTYGGIDDELGVTVRQTMDGGYIITGFTPSFGAGGRDVYLIKTDAYGDTLWTRTYGGNNWEVGISVQQTTDGGYIITGFSDSFGNPPDEVYLIKTDSGGNLLWSKTFGGSQIDHSYSVQQTTDGGYILTGYTYSFGVNNVYLIKTDASGGMLWSKSYGGSTFDFGNSVQQTLDGGYIIAGYTKSFGAGGDDVYLIKTDINGDTLWTKTYGGNDDDFALSVQQTIDGGFIILGSTASFGVGDLDAYVIKTDSDGVLIWSKTLGKVNYQSRGISICQTADSGFILSGYYGIFSQSNHSGFLVKTDSYGDTLWTKSYGGNTVEQDLNVQLTSDGGYIMVGGTVSFGAGGVDVYLIKTDSLGNSGCNEANPGFSVTTPATQIISPATIVTLPPTIVLAFPNTQVGSGGTVTTLCITVGMNEITLDSSFIISPNPSSGNFIVSFEESIRKGHVEILNILGENVFAGNIFNESKIEINLKNISQGIYFVKVYDGEKSYCKKLIVVHD